MNEIFIAASVMLGISVFFGVVLASANRFLKVQEDPRIDRIEEMLPGTNCGACGQPGCRGFAEALVSDQIVPGKCTVSTADAIEGMAHFLGVDAGFQEKVVARLHCAGGRSSVAQVAEYHGLRSCRAAFVVNGGGKACPWGCLGLGDCDKACDFNAIHMSRENLPVVNEEKCTACNDCVEICPLDLFSLMPVSEKAVVQCSSPLAGDPARAMCRVACDSCGRCAVDAGEGVITMEGGLPVVQDPVRTTEACTFRCPTGAIQWVEGGQFRSDQQDAFGDERLERHA